MLNKFAAVALVALSAVPAFAQAPQSGHDLNAALLGLDASQFTTNELAQINAEDRGADRVERAKFILEQKSHAMKNAVASDDAGSFSYVRGQGRDN